MVSSPRHMASLGGQFVDEVRSRAKSYTPAGFAGFAGISTEVAGYS